jgi:hypothetical protein
MAIQILDLHVESWPKFEQASKKVPTPSALELLAFDE